jgi:hypothetical protein
MRELSELQASWNIHPWGPYADDLRAARLCATVANFSAAVDWKKRGRRPFEPKDFLPTYEVRSHQTPEQQIAALKMLPSIQLPKKPKKNKRRK